MCAGGKSTSQIQQNNVNPFVMMVGSAGHVSPEGEYVNGPPPGSMREEDKSADTAKGGDKTVDTPVKKASSSTAKGKSHYITMLKTRVALTNTAGGSLAKACVIAARYSPLSKNRSPSTPAFSVYTAVPPPRCVPPTKHRKVLMLLCVVVVVVVVVDVAVVRADKVCAIMGNRYSAVRHQGFKNTTGSSSFKVFASIAFINT